MPKKFSDPAPVQDMAPSSMSGSANGSAHNDHRPPPVHTGHVDVELGQGGANPAPQDEAKQGSLVSVELAPVRPSGENAQEKEAVPASPADRPQKKEKPKEGGAAKKQGAHLEWLDLVRFFAVVTVVCGHLGDIIDRSNRALDSPPMIMDMEKNRIGRARSFGAQYALPLLFYASGLSQSFVVPKVTTCNFLARRSWRLLLPFAGAWLLFVWPVIWISRDFYQEGVPVRGEEYNFITGLEKWPSVIDRGGLMYLWFLVVLFILGLINHPFFRFINQTRKHGRGADGQSTLWRIVGGLFACSVYVALVIVQYKVLNGRDEVDLVSVMAMAVLPYFFATGFIWWQCWYMNRPVQSWFPLTVLMLNFGVSVGLAGPGFKTGLALTHQFLQYNFFYMQGFIDGEFADEYKSFFSGFLGQSLLVYVGAAWGPVVCVSFADDCLKQRRYYLTFPGGHSFEQVMYDMVIAWFWVYALCAAATYAYTWPTWLTPRIMDLINKTGFILYLSHWLFIQSWIIIFVWPTKAIWTLAGICFLTLPLTVLCALILVLIFERVPGLGHVFGLYGTHRRFNKKQGEGEKEGKETGGKGGERPQFTLQVSGDWGEGPQTPGGGLVATAPSPLRRCQSI
uniref:Acyltransferase 3 domain-containing protein n=1 Tax=Chromera velia CCMP2878 TaxID=1169474 RepID=A0A0G4HJV3_9ALVE|eukprot:Cvel_28387.t1-p1 / transcript=Cvel_28387.t1 / gene=Cvel_28387 / organism=Chromera_velia_CCMP2878 / gene_product=hypothetical protein / transcript_product=hypothetical protein / location=Cvel_scaffold3706:10682-12978(+) / protein_length=621 / sequence_SO=supercontig / SO=protein_coding / is_pseudo=false